MFGALYTSFILITIVGAVLLALDAAWYLKYRAAASELKRYSNGFPIKDCPTCKGELRLIETITHSFFIPSIHRKIVCSQCSSQLIEITPDKWKYSVDGGRNQEIEWLYDGEVLSTRDLNGILVGKHTTHALAKISNKQEQERRTARRNALNAISNGKLSVLDKLESRLVEMPSGVQANWGKQTSPPIELKLQKGEICLLVMRPMTYGEERTKDNVPYIKVVEQGEFFITNRRYGFIGGTKTVAQKLDAITRIGTRQGKLFIVRSNRKSPEFFIDLDNELVEAVLNGARLAE